MENNASTEQIGPPSQRYPGAGLGFVVTTVIAGLMVLISGFLFDRDFVILGGGLLLAFAGLLAILTMRQLISEISGAQQGIARLAQGYPGKPITGSRPGPLAEAVNALAKQMKSSRLKIEQNEQTVIDIMSQIIHGRSYETVNHTVRVGEMSCELARLVGLPPEEAELLRFAAPLHDLGKVGIPDAIINKPGKFTAREFSIMQKHAALGHRILARSERPELQAAAIIALQHHERWDGMGYPNRLQGEEIHIYGRIVGLVDVFDAMFSERVYRKALTKEKALGIIKTQRGHHFDPHLLDLFLANLPRFLSIIEQYKDVDINLTPSQEPNLSGARSQP
jgi:putative nucleotidyltransferase with HDIG domain